MSTRLILIRDSNPIAQREVRVEGIDGPLLSDADGIVDLGITLSEPFTVQVANGSDWVNREVAPRAGQALLVVELGLSRAERRGDAIALGDRYEYQRVLGRGGMGVVIEAQDTVLKRRVAIKILSDELRENEEARAIFLQEGRSLAGLAHPNLVAVFDVAALDDNVMIVLEYVEGSTIESTIEGGESFEQVEAARIAIQLVRALEYLHEQGIIHRDVKPANMMLQPDGTVKLVDFGLARSLEHILVRGTRVRGSPAYMAPEQIQGDELTAATDIYQVGVTLFEMLAGELPFKAAALPFAHVSDEPPDLRDLRAELDERLAAVVAGCLAKSPEERPSATRLLSSLRSVHSRLTSSGEHAETQITKPPVSAIAPEEDPVLDRPSRPKLLIASLVGVALIAIVMVVAVASRPTDETTADSPAPAPTPSALVTPAAPRPQAPLAIEPVPPGPAAVVEARRVLFASMGEAQAIDEPQAKAEVPSTPKAPRPVIRKPDPEVRETPRAVAPEPIVEAVPLPPAQEEEDTPTANSVELREAERKAAEQLAAEQLAAEQKRADEEAAAKKELARKEAAKEKAAREKAAAEKEAREKPPAAPEKRSVPVPLGF